MKVEKNIVISEFITNMEDIWYGKDNTQVNIAELAQKQAESLKRFNVPYYVLTNNEQQQTSVDNLKVVKVPFEEYPKLTLYLYRLILAFNFIQAHPEIEKVALTDVEDVTMLRYPFDEVEDGKLYMGYEQAYISNFGRPINANENPDYIQDFLIENGNLPVVNLGIMVATRAIMIEFLSLAVKLITDEEVKIVNGDKNSGIGKLEMSICNYIAYRYFGDRLIYGKKVSTLIGAEQIHEKAWFKHK